MEVTTPNAMLPTTVISYTVFLSAGETDLTNDFGFNQEEIVIPPGSISDAIWIDENGNGIRDEGEPGLGGVTVVVLGEDGEIVEVLITDENGNFIIENLEDGAYTIEIDLETVPGDLYPTTNPSVTYVIEGGNGHAEEDFGFNTAIPITDVIEVCTDVFTSIELCPTMGATEVVNLDASHSTFNCNFTSSTNDCITYTPFPAFEGTDTATVIICETIEPMLCREVVYVVQVGCVQPEADNDSATITENSVTINGTTTATTTGYEGINMPVINNDGGLCNSDLMPNLLTYPANGTATVNEDGTISYIPNDGFSGTESMTYEACNDCGLCTEATITVHVEAPMPPCETFEVELCTAPIEPIVICPDFCLEGDYSVTEVNTIFDCSINIQDNTCVEYTALPAFYGLEAIEIVACDAVTCDTAYVNILVTDNCNNEPPVAVDDVVTTDNMNAITFDVLTNDNDPNGDNMTIQATTDPENGTVEYHEDGTFTYTPNEGFEGTDTFTYQLCDEYNACDFATVTVEVAPPAEPCSNTTMVCAEPVQPLVLCPQFCDLPANSDVTIMSANTTYSCSIQLDDDNPACLQYTALPLFVGQETITVVACNQFGVCDTAYVVVNVTDDCTADGSNQGFEGDEGGKLVDSLQQPQNTPAFIDLSIQSVTPMPATNFAHISFTSNVNQTAQLSVTNMLGELMYQNNITAQTGLNLHRINVNQFSKGVYIITLSIDNNLVTHKLIKQ